MELHAERTGVVRRELTIDATREEVWRALSEPALLRDWLAPDVELELEPGGEGYVLTEHGEERALTVEAADEGERLAFRWEREGIGETLVELELVDASGGTRVVVTESGLPAPAMQAAGLAWSGALTALAAVVMMLAALLVA
jgi:uncharacterized protein YndB with AHSA1/START domain